MKATRCASSRDEPSFRVTKLPTSRQKSLGSAPANMEAGKALDAYGSMPGHDITQG